MGMILKEVKISGLNEEDKKLTALFDTGTRINHISSKFKDDSLAMDLGIVVYGRKQKIHLPNLKEEINGRMIKLKSLKIEGTEPISEPKFCLWDMKLYDMIIGAELMQQLGMVLTPSVKQISFPSN